MISVAFSQAQTADRTPTKKKREVKAEAKRVKSNAEPPKEPTVVPAENEVAVWKIPDCPRCQKIQAAGHVFGPRSLVSLQCDVGLKALFRAIRNAAFDIFAQYETNGDIRSDLRSHFAQHCPGVSRDERDEMARLVIAFRAVNHKKIDHSTPGLTRADHELCTMLQQVCYNFKRVALKQVVGMSAFQHLLDLPAFSKDTLLVNFKLEVQECRANQYAVVRHLN